MRFECAYISCVNRRQKKCAVKGGFSPCAVTSDQCSMVWKGRPDGLCHAACPAVEDLARSLSHTATSRQATTDALMRDNCQSLHIKQLWPGHVNERILLACSGSVCQSQVPGTVPGIERLEDVCDGRRVAGAHCSTGSMMLRVPTAWCQGSMRRIAPWHAPAAARDARRHNINIMFSQR